MMTLNVKLETNRRVVYEPKRSSRARVAFSELRRSFTIKTSDWCFSSEISVQYWTPTRLRMVQTAETDKKLTPIRNISSCSTKTKIQIFHESNFSIVLCPQKQPWNFNGEKQIIALFNWFQKHSFKLSGIYCLQQWVLDTKEHHKAQSENNHKHKEILRQFQNTNYFIQKLFFFIY